MNKKTDRVGQHTTVAHLNKEGGLVVGPLSGNRESVRIVLGTQVTFRSIHHTGKDIELADYLSRNWQDDNKWSLTKRELQDNLISERPGGTDWVGQHTAVAHLNKQWERTWPWVLCQETQSLFKWAFTRADEKMIADEQNGKFIWFTVNSTVTGGLVFTLVSCSSVSASIRQWRNNFMVTSTVNINHCCVHYDTCILLNLHKFLDFFVVYRSDTLRSISGLRSVVRWPYLLLILGRHHLNWPLMVMSHVNP